MKEKRNRAGTQEMALGEGMRHGTERWVRTRDGRNILRTKACAERKMTAEGVE